MWALKSQIPAFVHAHRLPVVKSLYVLINWQYGISPDRGELSSLMFCLSQRTIKSQRYSFNLTFTTQHYDFPLCRLKLPPTVLRSTSFGSIPGSHNESTWPHWHSASDTKGLTERSDAKAHWIHVPLSQLYAELFGHAWHFKLQVVQPDLGSRSWA